MTPTLPPGSESGDTYQEGLKLPKHLQVLSGQIQVIPRQVPLGETLLLPVSEPSSSMVTPPEMVPTEVAITITPAERTVVLEEDPGDKKGPRDAVDRCACFFL